MTTRRRPYHTLLVRETKASKWGIHFGDYDRETVDQERADITERDYLKGNTKIITTTGIQADIDAAVAKLNEGIGQ